MIDLNVIWIVVIVAMTVIEVVAIEIIPVATPLVVVLLLEIVLHVLETLLPAETNEMEDGEEATVDLLLHVGPLQEEEAKGIEVVVQRPMIGEEIVTAMRGMTETRETICETFEIMETISVPILKITNPDNADKYDDKDLVED